MAKIGAEPDHGHEKVPALGHGRLAIGQGQGEG